MRQAALRNRQWKRLEGEAGEDTGLIVPRAQASPEHYHLVYNAPKENVSIPDFGTVYVTAREAYQKVYDLGMRAQPNAEFYDEGLVGFETRMAGRADLWWIVVEVAACIKARCLRSVERAQQKRQLVLVPESESC